MTYRDRPCGPVEPGRRSVVPDHVDDVRVEADRDRFHFMKRPLVRLVMLAGRRQDGKLRQRAPEGGFQADIHA